MDREVEDKKRIMLRSQGKRRIRGERSCVSETAARSGTRKAEKCVLDLAISWNGDRKERD